MPIAPRLTLPPPVSKREALSGDTDVCSACNTSSGWGDHASYLCMRGWIVGSGSSRASPRRVQSEDRPGWRPPPPDAALLRGRTEPRKQQKPGFVASRALEGGIV